MPRSPLMTEAEAAEFLAMAPKTLRNIRSSGLYGPPFLKLGDGPNAPVRYRRETLEAWIEGHAEIAPGWTQCPSCGNQVKHSAGHSSALVGDVESEEESPR